MNLKNIATVPCDRCDTTERIVTLTDDKMLELCVFCMAKRARDRFHEAQA
jgi:hypothetical protein